MREDKFEEGFRENGAISMLIKLAGSKYDQVIEICSKYHVPKLTGGPLFIEHEQGTGLVELEER